MSVARMLELGKARAPFLRTAAHVLLVLCVGSHRYAKGLGARDSGRLALVAAAAIGWRQ